MRTHQPKQLDSHVKARLSLAKRVAGRWLEWSASFERKRAREALGVENLSLELLLPFAFDAISQHTYRPSWGDKFKSQTTTFGYSIKEHVGTAKTIPTDTVHDIMCRMRVGK